MQKLEKILRSKFSKIFFFSTNKPEKILWESSQINFQRGTAVNSSKLTHTVYKVSEAKNFFSLKFLYDLSPGSDHIDAFRVLLCLSVRLSSLRNGNCKW